MTSRKRIKHTRHTKKSTDRSVPSSLWIIGGLVILALVILFLKDGSKSVSESGGSLETQLDESLQAGRPVFVFLHSLECIPCKEMMRVVAEVYPEYSDFVDLVDVDIYNEQNASLLRREKLQAIPTLVFYDRHGKRQVYAGVMEADQLHLTLQSLASEK